MMENINKTVYLWQPSEDILLSSGYYSFEVWTRADFAARDCKCAIDQVGRYREEDIEDYQIVR